jgi:hypothetical protein
MRTINISVKMRVVLLVLILSLLVSAFSLVYVDLTRPRHVLGNGSSQASAGKVSLRATLGESIVGTVSSRSVSLGQGFWHAGQAVLEEEKVIFLPLLSKDN